MHLPEHAILTLYHQPFNRGIHTQTFMQPVNFPGNGKEGYKAPQIDISNGGSYGSSGMMEVSRCTVFLFYLYHYLIPLKRTIHML